MIARVFVLIAILCLCACTDGSNDDRMIGQLASVRIEVAAEVSERIVSHDALEGVRVNEGASLLTQNMVSAANIAERASATQAMRQAELDELLAGTRSEQLLAKQASVKGAIEDKRYFESELKRLTDLVQRKLVSDEQRDTVASQLDRSEAQLATLQAELSELLNGAREQTIRRAKAALDVSVADVSAADIHAARHRVLAPSDGVLDQLLLEPGETPAIGQAVAILLSGDQPQAEIYVPAALRMQITPGVELDLFIDGLDEPVVGRVRRVSDAAAFTPYFALTKHDRGRLSYLAEVDVRTDGDRLPDGVVVEAVIASKTR